MLDAERITTAIDRNSKAISLRPSLATMTATLTCRHKDQLQVEMKEGKWTLTSDVHAKSGGDTTAADPSLLGRAALAACMTMAYVIWSARLDIPISNLKVEVQGDFDVRGQYGDPDIPAGYSEVRYTVSLDSPASEEDVMRLLDKADDNCPLLDIFARPQKMVRNIVINPQAQEG